MEWRATAKDGHFDTERHFSMYAHSISKDGVQMNPFGFGHNQSFDSGLKAFETGDSALAIEHFGVCLASDPDPSTRERARSYLAGSHVRLAKESIKALDWDAAIEHLEEAVSYRPSFADLRILRSIVFDHLGRQEDREYEISFALEFNSKYGLAILHDGIIMIEHSLRDQGLARFQEALSADKRLNGPVFQKAADLLRAGKVSESVALFKTVVPVMDVDPSSLILEGNTFAHDGRWAEAEEAYRRALELAPRFADLICKHGRVLAALGRNDEAIAQFREAVDINPHYADAYAFLGIALREAGYTNQATDAFNAALSIDPGHVVALRETRGM